MRNIIVVLVLVGGCSTSWYQAPLREATEEERTQVGDFLQEKKEYGDLNLGFLDVNNPLDIPVKLTNTWALKIGDTKDGVLVTVIFRTEEQFYNEEFHCVPFWTLVTRRGGYETESVKVSLQWDWESSKTLEAEGVTLEIVWRDGKLFARVRFTADLEHKLE